MEAYQLPEVYDDRFAYGLSVDEEVVVARGRPPLLSAEESWHEFGLKAPLLIAIGAGEAAEKLFYIFDVRQGMFGIAADLQPSRPELLLADESFYAGSFRGSKLLWPSEHWLTIGRWHMRDRFKYPVTVSTNHFRLACVQSGLLRIHNLDSVNRTVVYARPWGGLVSA